MNIIRYNFEFTKQYIESEKEKTEAMVLMNRTIETLFSHVKELDKKIIDLEDSFVSISKGKALHFQLIELQGVSIKNLRETVENHQKILNSL